MKNPRTVFGIVAFVVAFVFSVGLVRIFFPSPVVAYTPETRVSKCRSSELGRNLEAFIRRDEANGTFRTGEMLIGSNVVSPEYADSVNDYWNASSSMDATRFPRDFRVAWNDHMKAWHDLSEFLNERKGVSVDREGFYSEAGRLDAEISRTWEAVLDSARQNGARVR